MEPLRKRPAAKPAVRGNDLARIHILKKDARLTDDEYRDLLQTLTGKRSAGDLSFEERARVCSHLTTLARKLSPRPAKPKHEPDAHERRLLAEWGKLRDRGAVTRAWSALSSWLTSNGYPARTEWMSTDQINAAIERLKQWTLRLDGDARDATRAQP